MGRYDFDKAIDRKNTASIKYDFGMTFAGRDDLLPLWVADMDFCVPDEIIDAIKQRAGHGIFGYSMPDARYHEALEKWFRRRYGWEIDRDWNTVVPGVVYGVACAIRALTAVNDKIIIQEPVYYPFRSMIEQNGRICVNNQLKEENGRYYMDFDGLEALLKDPDVKAMILCSPHNPVGRVWTREELLRVDELCRSNNVKVIADEIHCDFIYPGNTFTPFGSLGQECRDNSIICTSPSKTFNLAGLQISNILIPSSGLRKAFRRENSANGYGEGNIMGLVSARAAYEYGDEWLDELIDYLWANVAFVRGFLSGSIPDVRLIEPEGTYLLWTDFSQLVSTEDELKQLIEDKAHLWLDGGGMFGRETALFERFNIACPRSTLSIAMEQLAAAAGDFANK